MLSGSAGREVDRRRSRYAKPPRTAKPAGTPTPTPTPMATFLLLGDALGEGVTRVAVDEGEGVGSGEVDEGDIVDDVDDAGRDDTAELGVRGTPVVEGTLV